MIETFVRSENKKVPYMKRNTTAIILLNKVESLLEKHRRG